MTLKKATTNPPGMNMLQQQDKFEDFIHEFNYEGLPDLAYPFHNKTVTITNCGRICLVGKKIHFSTVFAGQDVGLRPVEDDVWPEGFMEYDMRYFDLESHRVQALENSFGPKVLNM